MSSKVFRDRLIASRSLAPEKRDAKQRRDRKGHDKAVARNKLYVESQVRKRGGCCEVCGLIDDPSIFEWHHINYDEKIDDVSSIVGAHASVKRIQEELDKCILVCPTCHKKIHMDLTCMLDHKNRPDLIPYSHVESEIYIKLQEGPEPTPIQLLFNS